MRDEMNRLVRSTIASCFTVRAWFAPRQFFRRQLVRQTIDRLPEPTSCAGPRRMTFAELFLFLAGVALLFRLLRPLQRRLEARLYRYFLSRRPGASRHIIDVTDYDKKAD
jgi:hypothetical protein